MYLLVFGLPFAITLGWIFGAPATPSRPVAATSGVGTLGTAPTHVSASRPVTPVEWSSPTSPRAARVPLPGLVPAGVLPASAAPSVEATPTPSPTPIFSLPPVPIPATITPSPSEASATPSDTPEPESSGLNSAPVLCTPEVAIRPKGLLWK